MVSNYYYSKKIIAFLGLNRSYMPNDSGEQSINKFCYAYPRYLQMDNGEWSPVDPNDFPTLGRFDVSICNGQSAEEIIKQFGPIVSIKIRNISPKPTPNPMTWYQAQYNPNYGKDNNLMIEELGSAKLNLWQVITSNMPVDQFVQEKRIVEYSGTLFTSIVFVRIKDIVFGPFRYDKKGNCIELAGLQESDEIAGQYAYDHLTSSMMDIRDHNENCIGSFIHSNTASYNEFIEKYSVDKIDWVNDSELLDMLIKTFKKSSDLKLYKSQVRQLRTAIDEAVSLEDQLSITEKRKTRLQFLLAKTETRVELLEQISYFMMDNEEAEQRLMKTIAEDGFDLIKDKLPQMSAIQDKIAEKQQELDQINSSIAESRERALQANREDFERQASEKTKQIQQLEIEVATLEAHKAEIEKHTQITGSILDMQKTKEDLDKEIKKLQSDYDYQKGQNDRLEEQVKKIMNELKSEATLAGKLLDKKLLDRVLKTVSGEELEEENDLVPYNKSLLTNGVTADTIIDYLYNDIQNRANRNVSRNDVINYLLCVMKGFITVFAGVPGTGKTSLCYLLAKSLGLAREGENSRYLEVSVERGWSSHKDYIGYYNPLTKRLEKSNAEIFNAFLMLEGEADASENAPFFILLDEANLSPIEHYWAPFLKLCDSDSCSGNMLVLGGDEKWRVPKHLRFLATVNFDHTTEELSPRFLDRAWIISLEPEMLKLVDIEDDAVTCNNVTYDFSSLELCFAVSGKEGDILKPITTKWENIQKIFKDNKIPIMPRNLKMVKNYIITACSLMETQSEDTKFAPIDYAVAQKILPIINGSGEKYDKPIADLLRECESMPLCKDTWSA